jgi:hypothetical protein
MELMEVVTCSIELFGLVSFIIVFTSWILFRLKKREVKPQMDPIMIVYQEETVSPEYLLRKRLNERFVLINKNYGRLVSNFNYGGFE